MLLGIHEARLFPTLVLSSHDNLLLLQSSFGSGLLLAGLHPVLNTRVVVQNHQVYKKARANYRKQVNHVLSRREHQENNTNSPENTKPVVSNLAKKFSFLECEEMGIGQPRRCQACSTCNKCSVW